MRWHVIIKIKVLCQRSGSHRKVKQNDNLCPVQSQGSKVSIRGLWGHLSHTVTFLVFRSASILQVTSRGKKSRSSSIMNQIMPLGVIGPCFQIGFNLADN